MVKISSKNPFFLLPFGARITILLSLVLIVLLPITVLTTMSPKDTRSKAAETTTIPNTYLVLHLTKDLQTNEISVEEANAYNTLYMPIDPNPDQKKTDELQQTINGKVVSTKQFNFITTLYSPPPPPGQTTGNPPTKLQKPEAIIFIPYYTGAELQIKNMSTQKSQPVNMTKIVQALTNIQSVELKQVPDETIEMFTQNTDQRGDGYFDVLFMSSHYSNFNLFHKDVKKLGNFLKTIKPYSEFGNGVRIQTYDNTADLGCFYDSSYTITCNWYKIASQAVKSGIPYDTIVVVENNNTYGGRAIWDGIAVTYRDTTHYAYPMMIHEMGHSVAQLHDEYDFGITDEGYEESFPNCDEAPSCSEWAGTPGTGCYQICGYRNWHKPTSNNCIMETFTNPNGVHFDPIDEPVVRNRINRYVGSIRGNVFQDTNKNARRNPQEPFVNGVTIDLKKQRVNGKEKLITSITTNAEPENLTYHGLDKGKYRLSPTSINSEQIVLCGDIQIPANPPKDRYFYCSRANGSLQLKKWDPNLNPPYVNVPDDHMSIDLNGEDINVDIPLL